MLSRATARSSSSPTRCCTDATSTCSAATSTARPSASGVGTAAGTMATATADIASASALARRPLPHRSHASSSSPDTSTTANESAHTPPDRRERERRRVHLGRPELSPPEPAEREHAPDPLDDRPQARQSERPEHRVIPAPHGGRQGPEPRHEPGGHQHEGRPSELAEEQDPIQERAEVGDTEREAARGGPAGSGSTHEPQERDRRDEHERPDPRRRERDRQQRTGGRRDQERVRKSEPTRAQAQSRQSIFALSFSWLRCLTR